MTCNCYNPNPPFGCKVCRARESKSAMDNPFFATAVVGASSLLLFGIILLAVSPFLNWLGGYGFTWYF